MEYFIRLSNGLIETIIVKLFAEEKSLLDSNQSSRFTYYAGLEFNKSKIRRQFLGKFKLLYEEDKTHIAGYYQHDEFFTTYWMNTLEDLEIDSSGNEHLDVIHEEVTLSSAVTKMIYSLRDRFNVLMSESFADTSRESPSKHPITATSKFYGLNLGENGCFKTSGFSSELDSLLSNSSIWNLSLKFDDLPEVPEVNALICNNYYTDVSITLEYKLQSIKSLLVEYGFSSFKMIDHENQILIAVQGDTNESIKVPLTDYLTLDKSQLGEGLWIVYWHEGHAYLCNHDELYEFADKSNEAFKLDKSWVEDGIFEFTSIPTFINDSGLLQKLN